MAAFRTFSRIRWIRDRYTWRWEKQVKPEDEGVSNPRQQKRRHFYLSCHGEVRTDSTRGTAFAVFTQQETITNPWVMIGNPAGNSALSPTVYYGTWDVVEGDVEDRHDGTSVVRVSLELEEAWQDIES